MFASRSSNNSDRTKVLILAIALCLAIGLLVARTRAEQGRSGQGRPEQTPNLAQVPAQQRVQPLDPLTPAEIELAGRLASSDPRVKEALGKGRQLLVQVLFLALKNPDYRETNDPAQMKIGRHAGVLFYLYEMDRGLHVVVDLEQKAVGEITRLEGTAVPLAYEEVTEAFNLAIQNERVKALFGPRLSEFKLAPLSARERPRTRVEGLRLVATSPTDPCFRHRCVDLLFRLPEGYIANTSVTVDLTAQTVRVERKTR